MPTAGAFKVKAPVRIWMLIMEWLAQGPWSIFGIDARILSALYADDCVIVAERRECPNPVRGSAVFARTSLIMCY